MLACKRSGRPAAEVVHSGGIDTTNEAGTSPSQHDQGRTRQQERRTTARVLLNQTTFSVAARPEFSTKNGPPFQRFPGGAAVEDGGLSSTVGRVQGEV